jgi:hypothetical protein
LCYQSCVFADTPTAEGLEFFETNIRPVLVARCYKCHSEKAVQQDKLAGELLLDTRQGTHKGGESGPAIVPGDLEASLLIAAIRHDSTTKMPPDTKLSDKVIANFVRWVEMDAPDPRDSTSTTLEKQGVDLAAGRKFWAFQPLAKTEPPTVNDPSKSRTKIDSYVLSRLEAKGLTLNDAASRRVLIRRVYFDVWGLPPDPAEVEAFVNDPSPDAYDQLVDRLLQGQHYGERWARHWLDLVRFAESNGYAFDKDRPAAFHYRDFTIKALNEDMPFDRFVQLQIAGDQLEPNDYMAQAATGFLAAGTFTSQQTQKERERSRYEQLDDIVGTIGTSLLGLTTGCARCHDHKFDPLSTNDYYRFTACFAEVGFQDFDYDPQPAATKAAKEAFDQAHKPFVDAKVQFEKEQLPIRLNAWLTMKADPPPREQLGIWQWIGPFAAADFDKAFNQAFAPEKGVDLQKVYDTLKWTPRPEWKDGQIHNTLLGTNSANYLYRTISVAQKGPLEISLGRDDAIKVWLNGKQVLAKKVTGGVAADQDKLTLKLKAGSNDLLVKIVNAGGPSGFYFSTKPAIAANIQKILDLAMDQRTDKQVAELRKWYAPRDPDWTRLNQAEQEHLKQKPTPDITKIYAARKNGVTYNFGKDTRKVYFLSRGNSNSKQGQATPGFWQVLTDAGVSEHQRLSGGDEATKTLPRVALASWLTDEEHGAGHLLARVIVNRLWQHHLGRGIVATPSNFGSQGVPPTHPLLLDFLATELIRGAWKLKPIHQMILKSAVYRQSCEHNPLAADLDPANQLWWRRGALRLEAEVIRDSLFAVSGSLDKTMFGKGSLDETSPRRSVYLTVKRSNLIPILQMFDAPDSIQSIGHRENTTVPPQALVMMNSPMVRKLAAQFGKRVAADPNTSPEQMLDKAYALALSRPATEAERERMLKFLTAQAASYGTGDAAMTQAMADCCQLILCLNEFIFVD